MVDVFLRDYEDSRTLEKEIVMGNYLPESAIVMLEEYMIYVRTDIETLDRAAKEELDEFNKAVKDRCEETKKKIRQREGLPETAISERRLNVMLIQEDLKKIKHELLFIQKLAFRKGWLS